MWDGIFVAGALWHFFEPMKRATPTGDVYSGWYFISILSIIVCVAYFVVGFDFDLSRKKNRDKENTINPIIKATNMTPRKFEELVADYYQNMGYTTETTPYSGDYGVDVIAQKGCDCHRWYLYARCDRGCQSAGCGNSVFRFCDETY